MTTCSIDELRLGDYVDGTLDPHEMRDMAAHLEICGRCRALVADLSALRVATRTLEPALPPPAAWARISSAVEADVQRRSRPWGWMREWLAPASLRPALAGAAVTAVLGAGTWLAWHNVVVVQRAAPAANASAVATFESELSLAEEHYTKAISSLEQITKTDGSTLDTQTAEVLQANLAVIDAAIGQSRDALKKEPTSEVAQESLFDALRSKVGLLQDTVALINEMRKGNQEGAARIVSGMNQ